MATKKSKTITINDLRSNNFRVSFLRDPVTQADIGWEFIVDFTETDDAGIPVRNGSQQIILNEEQAKSWEGLMNVLLSETRKSRGLEDIAETPVKAKKEK